MFKTNRNLFPNLNILFSLWWFGARTASMLEADYLLLPHGDL